MGTVLDGTVPAICWYAKDGICLQTPTHYIHPMGGGFTMETAGEISLWACVDHFDAARDALKLLLKHRGYHPIYTGADELEGHTLDGKAVAVMFAGVTPLREVGDPEIPDDDDTSTDTGTESGPDRGPSRTCAECGMTTHHPVDVREGYCSNCHDWTDEVGS
jgi:hypothetical protein